MGAAFEAGGTVLVETLQQIDQYPLETLRDRATPHFLFNALNSVEALASQDPARIPELVRGLSGCLRYWLQPTHDGLATVQQELDALAKYIQVERVRFEDRFEVELEIPEAARPQRVPQYFLQPLLENVLREGLGAGPRPLRVVVSCCCLDASLQVELRSTGSRPGLAAALGSGLQDLQQRLEALYRPDGYGWTLSERADCLWLTIEVPRESIETKSSGAIRAEDAKGRLRSSAS